MANRYESAVRVVKNDKQLSEDNRRTILKKDRRNLSRRRIEQIGVRL
jgi:hypothetical protein